MKLLAQVPFNDALELGKGKTLIKDERMYDTVNGFLSVIVNNVYILASVIFFFLLIFAGISIILGAGSGDAKKTAQGQKSFTIAIGGLIFVFTSYWIIQIIQKLTGIVILNPTI